MPSAPLQNKAKIEFLLLQLLDRDFLEVHDIGFAVILQADVAFQRPRAMLWLKVELALRHRVTFGVVRDFYAIQDNDSVRSVECDLHRVPLGTGLAGLG